MRVQKKEKKKWEYLLPFLDPPGILQYMGNDSNEKLSSVYFNLHKNSRYIKHPWFLTSLPVWTNRMQESLINKWGREGKERPRTEVQKDFANHIKEFKPDVKG